MIVLGGFSLDVRLDKRYIHDGRVYSLKLILFAFEINIYAKNRCTMTFVRVCTSCDGNA